MRALWRRSATWRELFSRRAPLAGTLAARLLAPIGLIGALLTLGLATASAVAVSAYIGQAVEARATQAHAVVDAILTSNERQLLATARQLASLSSVDEAIVRNQPTALIYDLVSAQVTQRLDLVFLVEATGETPVALSNPPDLDRLVLFERARSLPAYSAIAHAGGRPWILAVATHRSGDGAADAAVVAGRALDGPFLRELSEAAGLPLAVRHEGGAAGEGNTGEGRQIGHTFRVHNGEGEIEVILSVPLADYESTARLLLVLVALTGAATVAVFLGLSALVVTRLTRPLRALAAAASAVAAGDRERTVVANGSLEVAAMARAFNAMVAAVRDREDELRRLALQAREFAGLMEHQALHDTLTGLPNRVLLSDRLEQAIAAARRDKGRFALLVMDLDGFKEVNDTFGHQVGDALLREVGGRLRERLRATDTVARLGGDEFAVLLAGADGPGAVRVAEDIAGALERPVAIGGEALGVSASIGIAHYPEHGDDAHALMRRADIAMYGAKRSGGGHSVYTTEQEHHGVLRHAVIAQLREAIARDELVLHYQPQVELATGRVPCVEALVRWRHRERGLLSPALFLPLAAESELMRPITSWVLATALRQCGDWRRENGEVAVAVNLAMRDLLDAHLPESVADLLRAAGVPASSLVLEVTESGVMAEPERVMRSLVALREMGVRLAVDDFGTGYSSLAYLHRLPVQEVKIDKSFVTRMATDESSAAIARATIDLAHALRLDVVAEGVEDQMTSERLAALRCDRAQGYLFSPPLPAEELTRYLHARRTAPPTERLPVHSGLRGA